MAYARSTNPYLLLDCTAPTDLQYNMPVARYAVLPKPSKVGKPYVPLPGRQPQANDNDSGR